MWRRLEQLGARLEHQVQHVDVIRLADEPWEVTHARVERWRRGEDVESIIGSRYQGGAYKVCFINAVRPKPRPDPDHTPA